MANQDLPSEPETECISLQSESDKDWLWLHKDLLPGYQATRLHGGRNVCRFIPGDFICHRSLDVRRAAEGCQRYQFSLSFLTGSVSSLPLMLL